MVEFFTTLLLVVNLFTVLLGEYLLGSGVISFLSRKLNHETTLDPSEDPPFRLAAWPLGILLHLVAVLLIGGGMCSVDWIRSIGILFPRMFWAILALALPVLAVTLSFRRVRPLCRALAQGCGISYSIFFSAVLFFGLSLFDVGKELTTPWVFNYGDLPFHLGMITSFFWDANLFPEYQIYAGTPLSYPFFVNLWSALFWWPKPDFIALDFIFAVQWTVLWSIVFFAVRGDRFPLLPWALLLGGGSYDVLARVLTNTDVDLKGVFGGKLTREQFPWEAFLPTIWVTQRSALFGMAVLLSAVRLFHERWSFSQARSFSRFALAVVGLLLSFSLLVHTHSFVVGVLYVGAVVSVTALLRFVSTTLQEGKIRPVLLLQWPITLGVLLLPTVALLPFVWGKRSTVQLQFGWMPWSVTGADSWYFKIVGMVALWSQACCFVLPVLVLSIALIKKREEWIAFLLLFIFGNAVLMSVWEWDQIKFFIALYGVFLGFVGSFGERRNLFYQFALLLLIIPGAFQTLKFLSQDDAHAIFTASDLQLAEEIKASTDPCAIILAKNDHNSAVMLTGRRLYAGYSGWIWTHALDSSKREDALLRGPVSSLVERIKLETDFDHCGVYILYSDRERAVWQESDIRALPNLLPTRSSRLFRVL